MVRYSRRVGCRHEHSNQTGAGGLILDPVSDGKHVILIMLITGLIFVLVIGLGELADRAAERRRERKRHLRPY
jgi:hypothetical protein